MFSTCSLEPCNLFAVSKSEPLTPPHYISVKDGPFSLSFFSSVIAYVGCSYSCWFYCSFVQYTCRPFAIIHYVWFPLEHHFVRLRPSNVLPTLLFCTFVFFVRKFTLLRELYLSEHLYLMISSCVGHQLYFLA